MLRKKFAKQDLNCFLAASVCVPVCLCVGTFNTFWLCVIEECFSLYLYIQDFVLLMMPKLTRATVVVNLSALSGKHGGEARVSEFSKWKFSLCQFFSLQVNLNL